MRSPSIIYLLVVLLAAFNTSCNKVNAVIPSGAAGLTEKDAAEVLANALLPAYGGMLAQANQAISMDKRSVLFCGKSIDSVLKANMAPTNIPVTCNYKLNWKYLSACGVTNSNITYNGTVEYDGPRFSASLSKVASGNLSGNSLSQGNFLLTLRINSEGNTVKKSVGTTPIKSKIELETSNLEFDKLTGQLVAGGEVSLNIADAAGTGFAYAGKFKVLSSKKGVLILNSGTEYTITWQ